MTNNSTTATSAQRQKLMQALAELSDAEWTQVRCDEDRRRAEQRTIRDLSRELQKRKNSFRNQLRDAEIDQANRVPRSRK